MRGNVGGINFQSGGIVLEGALVVAGEAQDFTERVLRVRGVRQHFGVTLKQSDGLLGFGCAGLDVCVAEEVERRRKIRIEAAHGLEDLAGAVVVLLGVQPIREEVEDVLVVGIAFQKIVHGADGGKQVAIANAGHPADEEPLVGGGAREKSFRASESGGNRNAPKGNGRERGVRGGKLRIFFYGAAGVDERTVSGVVFLICQRELGEVARFLRAGGGGEASKRVVSADRIGYLC